MSIFTSSVHVIYFRVNSLQWYEKWCRYFWRISLPEPFQLPHSPRSIPACLAGFHLLVFWIFLPRKSAGSHFAPCRVTPVKILDSLKELNTRTSADGELHFISLENSSILEIGDDSSWQRHTPDIFTLIAHQDDFKYLSWVESYSFKIAIKNQADWLSSSGRCCPVQPLQPRKESGWVRSPSCQPGSRNIERES